ncbi:hypothetical protein EHS13_31490 [Paenibacillus psychroresistens]|uniref:DUF4367 domain-containing protein n=1 Tax=Paenibacillus psychroresistens TaxID=1778678 RepID=A0A6B8RRQ9_9BACL|nr:hypothetical protein [Paenibacillus psychroresistens]QGQ99081.1 hypothetical protein EHS13_31490 [Paenibacillus psychroresistens]
MFKRIVIIALCLFVLAGIAYGVNSLQSKQGNSSKPLELTQLQIKEVHNAINEVRNQLSPDEAAFIYLAELDKIKLKGMDQGLGLARVNAPKPYTDLKMWKELTKENFVEFKTPTRLPNGYTFKSGALEYSMGNINPANSNKYYTMLKNKAVAAKSNMAWQKAESEDNDKNITNMDMPSLTYSNSNQDQIDIMYLILPLSVKVERKLNSADKVQVADIEGYYFVNKHNYLSETGTTQDIQWTEQQHGTTIQITVSSPSLNVTKEDLLLVANNLK